MNQPVNHMLPLGLNCCGLKEMHGAAQYWASAQAREKTFDPKQVILDWKAKLDYDNRKTVGMRYDGIGCGGVIFSEANTQVDQQRYGWALKAFIEAEGLGRVDVLPVFTNPNTSHLIQTFLWAVDQIAFSKWWEVNCEKGFYLDAGERYYKYNLLYYEQRMGWVSTIHPAEVTISVEGAPCSTPSA